MHLVAPIALLALCASSAPAQTLTAKIDSYSGPGDFILACPCFVAGEEAAVWLTAPCDGRILSVEVYWDSIFGGPSGPVDAEIIIYRDGVFPEPGALAHTEPVDFLEAGSSFGGQLNTIPLTGSDVRLDQNERFIVAFRFNADATDFLNSPSVNFDEALTPARCAVLTIDQGWADADALGVLGDWVIRAVIECGDPTPGACCLPATRCALFSEDDCLELGGTWAGEDTSCPTDCPKLCDGDINGDGDTTAADFVVLAANFAQTVQPGLFGDLTGNAVVDTADFVVLAGNFGCRND
jgi:hypothetical protein